MEVQSHRCAILIVVPVEIMVQKVVELVARQDVGARVHHGASRQVFVKVRVLAPVQLVHHHFPHGVASGWTVLQVSVTSVREIQKHTSHPSIKPFRKLSVSRPIFLSTVLQTSVNEKRPQPRQTISTRSSKTYYFGALTSKLQSSTKTHGKKVVKRVPPEEI